MQLIRFLILSELSAVLLSPPCGMTMCDVWRGGGGGGSCYPKKPNATANFKFGTGFFCLFFSVFLFKFWPILNGLTGSCYVVLVGYTYDSFYKTFAGLYRHLVC